MKPHCITLSVKDGVIRVYAPCEVSVTLVDFDVDPKAIAMSDVRAVKLSEAPYEAAVVGVSQFDAFPMGEIDTETLKALAAFDQTPEL